MYCMDFYLYVEKYLEGIIYKAVSDFLLRSDFELKFESILLEDEDDLRLKVYIHVSVKSSSESSWQKYTVTCLADLYDLDETFCVISVEKYKHIKADYFFNKNFVPILNKAQLELVSRRFSEKYNLGNGYVGVNKLLEKMGLKLKYRKLSLDGSIFGMICFSDIRIAFFDDEVEKMEMADGGTIFIDQDAMKNYAGDLTANFAIVHECIHWYLHRRFFAFKSFICKKFGNENDNSLKDSLEWMEYQANELASRILLPEALIKEQYGNIISKASDIDSDADLLERCIKNISVSAKVSKEAVKVRMLKLGFEVNGICEYTDNRYVSSYTYQRKLNYGETYTISFREMLTSLVDNSDLRELVSTNSYLFVDGHLCFKNTKYLILEDNQFKLTSYALNHLDECCVLFFYEDDKKYYNINNYDYILCKTQTRKHKKIIKGFEACENINKNPELFTNYSNQIYLICKNLPYGFRDRLRYLRESIGYSREMLEEKSNISVQTIKEIECNENRGYTVETIISLCIGLNLPPELSFGLIKVAGYDFEDYTNPRNNIYSYVLRNMYNFSIDKINAFLEANNFLALTRKL